MAKRGHPVQLSEWWADFDEHVMRPVFNKPDSLADWTPRSEGGEVLPAIHEEAWQGRVPDIIKEMRLVITMVTWPGGRHAALLLPVAA